MPLLEIVYLNGDVDRRRLEKQQPVSIGSHSSNDIRIDEEGVETLHCRIAWNKKAFEAVAAGMEGFEVNGQVVQKVVLKQGDVLRFGTVDLRFLENEEQGAELPLVAAVAADSPSVTLKPLSDELDVPDWLKGEPEAKSKPASKVEPEPKAKPAAESPKTVSRPKPAKPVVPEPPRASKGEKVKSEKPRSERVEKPSSKSKSPPPDDDDDFGDIDLDAGLEALAQESRASLPTMPAFEEESPDTADYDQPVKAKSRSSKAPKAEAAVREAEEAPPVEAAAGSAAAAAAPPRDDKVRNALRHQRRARPGEEDVLRSPLVIGLASAAVISLLLAAIFYFVGFRRSIQEEFDFAKAQFSENKFPQAIEAFNLFLSQHGEHALAPEATRIRGLAMVDAQITGAAPKFSDGLKELKDFIAEQRDMPDYTEQVQPEVAKRAGDIAVGASKLAGRVFESSLLDVARDAKSALVTASSKETPPTELIKEIDRNIQLSGAAILKHNTNNEQYKAIESAIAANKPLDALRLRRELLARYPDLETDKKIISITNSTLDKEKSLVKEEVLDRPAATDAVTAPRSLTLVYQARTRTDQVSVNRAVPVLSHGSLFGIDTVTGGPVWKLAIGVDTPFFPVRDSATNSLIAFNTLRRELMRIDQNTGNVLWRQPIEERASGRPLISEGQVFLPTVAGRLYRLEFESGTLVSRLTFSQPISNPVAVDDGARIVVSGDREVFYTLTSRPFACAAVSYLGQSSQSIVAPLLALGPYVLACQNLSNDASNLRLINTEPADQPLKEVASYELAGQVIDAPVVRGRNLFVPSMNERVASFQVSDEASQTPLVPGPKYEVKGAQPVVTHLSAAPDDQLFMASTAIRRLELKVDSLQPAQEAILLGKATQPLQYQDRLLFVARQRPFAESVVLTPIDRTSLTGEWQAIAGARILAASVVSGDNPSVVCVTESGQLFRVTAKALETGGFLSVAERLPLNEELADPIFATSLGEGQLVAAAGLPEPKMWLVNRLGQIERSATLGSPLQAPPVAMGNRILAPVNGRLQLLQAQGGQAAAQEYRLPGDLSGSTKWVAVVAADADSAAGVLENGSVIGVRLQKSPQAHLMESGRYNLEAPLVGRPHSGAGKLAVAGSNGRVAVLAVENLEPRGEAVFGGPIVAGPWISGELMFVEPGDGTLQARTIGRDLPPAWSLPLENDHVAGAPVVRGADVLIPLKGGRVVRCDAGTGEVRGAVDLHAALEGSPLSIGNALYATTLDGGLVRVPEGGQ